MNFANPLLFSPQGIPGLNVPGLFPTNPLLSLNPLLGAAQLGGHPFAGVMPSLESLVASGLIPGASMLPLMPQPMMPPNEMLSSVESLLKAAESSGFPPVNATSNEEAKTVAPAPLTEPSALSTNESAMNDSKAETNASETDSALGAADPSVDSDSALSDSDTEEEAPKSGRDGSGDYTESRRSGYGTRSKTKRLSSVNQSSRPSRQSSAGDADSLLADTEDEQVEKSDWDQLDEPLPSIELPKLPLYVSSSDFQMTISIMLTSFSPLRCSLDDRMSIFHHNLLLVDAGAPTLPDLDSPETWRSSLSPLTTEWTMKVLMPRYLARQAGTTPITSLTTLVSQRLTNKPSTLATSASTSGSQANRKKRSRALNYDGDGAENDDGDGEDQVPSKRSKASEDGERSRHVRFEGVEGAGEGDEPTEGPLGPASMKRRMSKGDEAVEVKRLPDGSVEMPLQFVSLTVTSLGEIVFVGEKFHSRRYIFPLGYTSKRSYYSLKDPTKKCEYIQEVIANPKNSSEPQFRLTCEDDALNPIVSSTPSGVWSEVLERIKPQREAIVGRTLHSTISGPEQFGFSHPIIHALIEELPNADKCAIYDRSAFFIPDARGKRKSKGPAPGAEEED